jgi:hypothetical protein
METQIKLRTPKLPKALADLTHSNQFLKVFSIFSVGVSALSLAVNVITVTRLPLVLTIGRNAELLTKLPMPMPEYEIKAAVSHYVELRYKWEPNTVNARLRAAEAFISGPALPAYQKAAVNIARFSIEKQVMQRVFMNNLNVDLSKRTVDVSGDRITAIQTLKAAGDLKLELSFESGPRTVQNPWGVYVSKEREE